MTQLKALLIDDDKKFCQIFHSLAEATFDLTITHSGKEGLAALNRAAFHVVLLDLKLGRGMNGLEILRRIKSSQPDLPVIMITDFADVETAVEAMKLGALHYMSKSPKIEELKLILDRQLEHLNWRLLYQQTCDGQNNHLVAVSPVMQAVQRQIARIAATDSTVSITGESGTGKEITAREIHRLSPRRDKPFVAINCSTLPATLFESEFFGHEKGAFTGADSQKKGKLEMAHQGTIFLDEIGDLPLESQAKILRSIEEKTFQRLGSTDTHAVNVRILAATNKDLPQLIRDRTFREDLFYRLNVISIYLPPLRERAEDIPQLAQIFLTRYAREMNKTAPELTPAALARLQQHAWPGNIRELRNYIERLLVFHNDGVPIEAADIQFSGTEPPLQFPINLLDLAYDDAKNTLLTEFKQVYFKRALQRYGGNKTATAQALGIDRASLYRILQELGLA